MKKQLHKDEIIIVPFSRLTPEFLSEEFLNILSKLLQLQNESIIFPFYIKKNIKSYGALFIHECKIIAIFGEGWGKNYLKIEYGDISIGVLLFPYIFSSLPIKCDVYICIDDEYKEESVKLIETKFDNKVIVVGCVLNLVKETQKIKCKKFFAKCYQKYANILLSPKENLLYKYKKSRYKALNKKHVNYSNIDKLDKNLFKNKKIIIQSLEKLLK